MTNATDSFKVLLLLLVLGGCTSIPTPPSHTSILPENHQKAVPDAITATIKRVASLTRCTKKKPCDAVKGVWIGLDDYKELSGSRDILRKSLYAMDSAYRQEIQRGNAAYAGAAFLEGAMWHYQDALFITETTLQRERTWNTAKSILFRVTAFGFLGLGGLLLR